MAINRLREMNVALLKKLGLRMIKFPNLLWARVLWKQYGNVLAAVQKRSNVSQV